MTREHWVFLHGTPLTPAVWRPIAERFRTSSTTVSCPSLERRGDSAEHAARVARDLPQDARLHIVGHSFGGQVALDLALLLADDERLASLGVVCSRATPFPAFAATARGLRTGQAPDATTAIDRWFTASERATGSPVIDYARQCLHDADAEVWADALDSIARYDRETELAAITAPAVIIAAEYDAVSPPSAMRTMAARMPRAEFHVLHEESHMGPFLRPDITAAFLRAGE